MEASSSSLCRIPSLWAVGSGPRLMNSTVCFVSPGRSRRSQGLLISNRRLRTTSALGELAATVAETGKAEITWQIIVGTVAGVTPFVVAGVEFSKRIIEQKRCEECRGTDLFSETKSTFAVRNVVGFFHGSHGEDSLQADDHLCNINTKARGSITIKDLYIFTTYFGSKTNKFVGG